MNIMKSHDIILKMDSGNYHIELKPMTDADLPLLYEWNKKSEVLYWCEGDDVVSNEPDDVDSIYGSISEKAFMFIITVNNIPLGECWLQDMNLPVLLKKNDKKNVKRIDMTIFEKEFWNSGFGTIINSMLLDFGFYKCKADLIYSITEDYNLRAQKCLLKSGFTFDEKFEHIETSKGKFEFCNVISKEGYLDKCVK